MNTLIARLLAIAALGTAVTGCATVPGDAYYEPAPYQVYEQPGYIYNAPPVYSAPPVYGAPPPATIYFRGRDRGDDRWERDRNRNDWRERERWERERERQAREREREREARDRDRARRDQEAREAERRQRDRAQALREQAERDRIHRDNRPGRLAPDSYTPSPYDWRSRQQSNNPDKP